MQYKAGQGLLQATGKLCGDPVPGSLPHLRKKEDVEISHKQGPLDEFSMLVSQIEKDLFGADEKKLAAGLNSSEEHINELALWAGYGSVKNSA